MGSFETKHRLFGITTAFFCFCLPSPMVSTATSYMTFIKPNARIPCSKGMWGTSSLQSTEWLCSALFCRVTLDCALSNWTELLISNPQVLTVFAKTHLSPDSNLQGMQSINDCQIIRIYRTRSLKLLSLETRFVFIWSFTGLTIWMLLRYAKSSLMGLTSAPFVKTGWNSF